MKAGLLVKLIWITLLRKILSEYLHEFNYDDFRLVKEECCADEGNTYWVFSNEFFEPASILTEENGLFEAYSPEEALILLQELYQLILQIWDIFFTSFSFQFVSYVTFTFKEIFICYSDFYFIARNYNWKKLPRQGQEMFLPRSCYAPYIILIRKMFQHIWVKKLPA